MVSQPSPFSSLSIEELKLLSAFTKRCAEAVQERARWAGVLHNATLQKDSPTFQSAYDQCQAAQQRVRECQEAVRLLQEELLRDKNVPATCEANYT